MDPKCFEDGVATIKCLPSLVEVVSYGFLIFSGMVALFIIAWAGIRMISSGGDAKQIESFKKMITFAIVGLIVVLSSFTIVNFIGYLTGSSSCINNLNTLLTGCR